MDSDFRKAVRLESPEVIPTTVSILPAMWIHHGREIEYLFLFAQLIVPYPRKP